VKKVVPDAETLQAAYLQAAEARFTRERMAQVAAEVKERVGSLEVPGDLDERVGELLDEMPELSWDEAVAEVVSEHL
jgi:hypothetical protein